VSDWEQYLKLKENLIATGRFQPTKESQRLKYDSSPGLLIDIIPFGTIANPDGSFSWPPEHAVEMNVLGFNESYNCALNVRISENPKYFRHR
jgi:predicted nucleotidyltransferase